MRSLTAITLVLSLFAFILWGASMFSMTVALAQELYHLLYWESKGFTDYVALCGGFNGLFDVDAYDKQHIPNELDYRMLDAIRYNNSHSLSHAGRQNEGLRLLRDRSIPMETAVIFYDRDGNILHENGDFVYFRYASEADWNAGMEEYALQNFGFFSLGEGGENDPYARFRTNSLLDIRVLRITGTIDGAEIKPAAIYYLTGTAINRALEQTEPTERYTDEDGNEAISRTYSISNLDRAGLLEWQTQFDHRANAARPEELVTIYAFHPDISVYRVGSMEYQNEKYDSLLALTKVLSFPSWTGVSPFDPGMYGMSEYGLDRILHFSGYTYRDWSGLAMGSGETEPEPELILVTAIASHPLRAAIDGLRNVYIATGFLSLLGVLLIRRLIQKRLIAPLHEIHDGIADGWTHIPTLFHAPAEWREPYELGELYRQTQDQLRRDKNEISRISTALDYAKTAEQNRRQMTSNIAHELKTPLAVIHSYAEGLKEHIAEEKRDKYLDVILSESERMDAMVLEMLDLSRLEAGKVRLSRDDFSLTELTRSIFDKLELAIRAKNLHIAFDLPGACTVTADEARIAQVIENFATNAIKYTPVNGNIFVRITEGRTGTSFAVANDCEPLSATALSKVWDTFYRTDEARSGGGTGLGLAIAKSIIDLHGGKCSVRNTETGVAFMFTI